MGAGYFKARNFPSKNNIAPAGINGAQRRRKYGASSTYKWVPTKSIPYMFSTKAGTTQNICLTSMLLT